MDEESLAVRYWRAYDANRNGRDTLDSDDQAIDEVNRLGLRGDPVEVLAVLGTLADTAPDDCALAFLGAGPVETYLSRAARSYLYGNDVPIGALLREATENERLRRAARSAYPPVVGPPTFWRLLDAQLGPPVHALRPWARRQRAVFGPVLEGVRLIATVAKRRS